jgi:lipopolysaccharide biosynthesis regulator YciM
MNTPSSQLAEKIMQRLTEEKLFRPEDQKKLLERIADGSIKQEDWRLAIELALGKEGGE